MKTLARALSVTLLAFTLIAPSAFADALSDGHSAEKAGKLLEALEHYTAALQQTREGSEDEYKLQERIIKLVRNLNPPPAVPEDAYRHMARGEAFLEGATNKERFKRAAKEFHTAARLAPWLPDVSCKFISAATAGIMPALARPVRACSTTSCHGAVTKDWGR